MMKCIKILSLLFFTTFYLSAQPAYNEQTLTISGGTVVAIDGEWAVVGDADNCDVHIYRMDYSTMQWGLDQTIDQDCAQYGGYEGFGTSVAISGTRIVVGAPLTDRQWYETDTFLFLGFIPIQYGREEVNPDVGTAYLYEYDGTSWNISETILTDNTVVGTSGFGGGSGGGSSDSNASAEFGFSVGVHSNTDGTAQIAIGSPGVLSAAIGTGKVFAYSWDGTTATLNTTLSGNVFHEHRFGASLDIKGAYLVVGAPDEESIAQNDFVGASYNYKFNGTGWEVNPDTSHYRIKRNTANEQFGTNVAINSEGNVTLISGGQNPTPTYIYTLNGSWNETYFKNFQDGGDVDIDEGVYMMASRSQELNFYSEVIGDTGGPNPLTISRASTDQAYTSVSLYKEQVLVNEPENDQAVAIDVPCGIKPGKLNAYEWAMVSVPCGDGSATIDAIFGDDLGTYGDNDNWVMYEQNGTEWSGTFPSMRQLASTDTMELGKGYWIITDTDATWKVDAAAVTTRTSLVTVSGVTVANDHIGGYYQYDLPAIGIGETKKIMAGNSFPRSFKWRDLLVGITAHYPIGAIGFYEGTGYVYDISQSGQPYRAITSTGTPGIGDEIKPYQGFWIKQKSQTTGGSGIKLSIPFEK